MTLRLLIASSFVLLATLVARAQSADDFFNGGAQFYISNNIPDALQKVEAGRKIYPEDVKLKKLEELLKQQQQQQQQNQQQQNQPNQQNQQNQSQQNKNSQNQQSQSQQQQKQNQSNSQKQQQNQQQQQAPQQQSQNGQQKQTPAQPAQAQAMSPEEAKRLLDAQKGNEQVLQYRPKGQPENANPAIKDW
jgi:spore cortex formation protein SpoVR/YcgB (stage V sporulation)